MPILLNKLKAKKITITTTLVIVATLLVIFYLYTNFQPRTDVFPLFQVRITNIENGSPIQGLNIQVQNQVVITNDQGIAKFQNIVQNQPVIITGQGLFSDLYVLANTSSLDLNLSYKWQLIAKQYSTYEIQRKYDLVYNMLTPEAKSAYKNQQEFIELKNKWRDNLLDSKNTKILKLEFEPNISQQGDNYNVNAKFTVIKNGQEQDVYKNIQLQLINKDWLINNSTIFEF